MADNGVDYRFVYVQLVQHLVGLDAVLLGIQLKVYVVKHADSCPELDTLGVKFLGELAHDLGNGLGVLKMESVLVEAADKLSGLLNGGDVTHKYHSLQQ